MNKKIIYLILQAPFILFVIMGFFGSIYAAIKKIGGITIVTPISLGMIIILYFYGRHLEKNYKKFI